MRRGELLQELSGGGLRGRLSQVYGAGAAEAAVRLRELVLEAIRSVSRYAIENEEEFVSKVREASEIRQEVEVMSPSRKNVQKSR